MIPNTPQGALPSLPGNVPPPPVLQTSQSGPDTPGANAAPSFLNMKTSVPSQQNLGQKKLIGA